MIGMWTQGGHWGRMGICRGVRLAAPFCCELARRWGRSNIGMARILHDLLIWRFIPAMWNIGCHPIRENALSGWRFYRGGEDD